MESDLFQTKRTRVSDSFLRNKSLNILANYTQIMKGSLVTKKQKLRFGFVYIVSFWKA